MRAASAAVALDRGGDDRQQRLTAKRRAIRRRQLTDVDFADELEPLRYHFHVRLDDRFAQAPELLHVLPVHDLAALLLIDPELIEQRRYGEERAEERVSLHAELQVGAIGRLPGD